MKSKLEERIKKILELTKKEDRDRIKDGPFAHINPKIVLGLLEQGYKMPQIAEVYGCCKSTVHNYMKRYVPNFDVRKLAKYGKWWIKDEEVVRLYKKYGNYEGVAEKLGISIGCVADRLERAGVKKPGNWRKDVSQRKVVRLYNENKSAKRVAEILDCSYGLIRKRLRKARKKIIREPHQRRDIPPKEVVRLYKKGNSLKKIGEFYHTDGGVIKRILREKGINPVRRNIRYDITSKQVYSMWKSGMLMEDIALELKCTVDTVRRRLYELCEKRGIDHPTKMRPDITSEDCIKLYKKYGKVKDVANDLKTSEPTVRERLRKGGIFIGTGNYHRNKK